MYRKSYQQEAEALGYRLKPCGISMFLIPSEETKARTGLKGGFSFYVDSSTTSITEHIKASEALEIEKMKAKERDKLRPAIPDSPHLQVRQYRRMSPIATMAMLAALSMPTGGRIC